MEYVCDRPKELKELFELWKGGGEKLFLILNARIPNRRISELENLQSPQLGLLMQLDSVERICV